MHWKVHLFRHFRLFQTFSHRRSHTPVLGMAKCHDIGPALKKLLSLGDIHVSCLKSWCGGRNLISLSADKPPPPKKKKKKKKIFQSQSVIALWHNTICCQWDFGWLKLLLLSPCRWFCSWRSTSPVEISRRLSDACRILRCPTSTTNLSTRWEPL